ncbi:Nucleoside-diphosphate-sugar epimerase [Sphingomonas laterariae]|uniref:Nucleoside-diphosphate-sugar epimerase n=1 Tax=Edaphosphingomonas laterariae TaxID=861865 RepID=A0A239EMI4_9SPHN|nr:NAD(P)H-binding protein [Sphingomonas laterariae]SNS45759.1 Nucleoside-diphosphate-sugar epimerase [Sphingomonas laterariae]
MKPIAITGGTGFVGGHVLRIAGERGIPVRALARGPQAPMPGVEWVAGALDDHDALARLCDGAGAVIHIAGVINAPDRSGFAAGNIAGTEAMVVAANGAGIRRFIHVSSLAAREPRLSDYGWSKAESEKVMEDSALDWTIVRPPAVYGPGDHEMLELFRMAAKGFVTLPPAGRLSLIEASDLARLLLDLVDAPAAIGQRYEPDDGRAAGWDHREFALALGDAVGRPVKTFAVPAPVLRLAAAADGLFRGKGAKLTPDRVRYFCHPDWVVGADARPPAAIWRPQVETHAGLKATADSYRTAGWL